MRVACPGCLAEYDLPPALAARLGEGRTVRCARCGLAWAPEGPAPAPDMPPPDGSEMTIPDRPAPAGPEPAPVPAPIPDPVPAPVTERGAGAAWAGSLLLLAAAAGAAWHWRVDLVEAWPPAARAFVALGLAG